MGQRPHEPTGFVRHVEIGPDFEAVEALEHEAQPAEKTESPPAKANVPVRPCSGGRAPIFSSRAQGGIVAEPEVTAQGVSLQRRGGFSKRTAPDCTQND